jgi:hypothetical protein
MTVSAVQYLCIASNFWAYFWMPLDHVSRRDYSTLIAVGMRERSVAGLALARQKYWRWWQLSRNVRMCTVMLEFLRYVLILYS